MNSVKSSVYTIVHSGLSTAKFGCGCPRGRVYKEASGQLLWGPQTKKVMKNVKIIKLVCVWGHFYVEGS